MKNPHEEGTVAWDLHEAAAMLERSEEASADMHRTIAMYRLGAALVSSLNFIGRQLGEIAEQVEMHPFQTAQYREREAEAAKPPSKRKKKNTRRK
jgi:hypothetical protein